MGVRPSRPATVLVLVLAVLVLFASPAAAAPVNTAPPSITGKAVYDAELSAEPGQWTPTPASYSFQWLRDGQPIAGATGQRYRTDLDDIGHRLSVTVLADDGAGGVGSATSAQTGPIDRAELRARGGQKVVGVARFTHTLTARSGRWSTDPTRVRYQWRRNGEDIDGATGRRFEIRPDDVGARLRVLVTAKAPGYRSASVTTDRTGRVRHRIDVRRVVTYRVQTRGRMTTSVKDFASLAQATFEDPRGWRGAGIGFRRVARGGTFSLVLSEARLVPTFSPVCSSTWSCRVGRFVIINQERWKHASPAWNAANLALRDYRHMVVNHETGHWLGLGHASCPARGRLAPVMMQQSKGLGGCRFNPFPTAGELARRTPSGRAMADDFGRGYPRAQAE